MKSIIKKCLPAVQSPLQQTRLSFLLMTLAAQLNYAAEVRFTIFTTAQEIKSISGCSNTQPSSQSSTARQCVLDPNNGQFTVITTDQHQCTVTFANGTIKSEECKYDAKNFPYITLETITATAGGIQSQDVNLTIHNQTGASQTVYFMIDHPAPISDTLKSHLQTTHGCQYPDSSYSGDGNKETTCNFILSSNSEKIITLPAAYVKSKVSLSISAAKNHFPKGPCNTTQAEITINDQGYDSYDVSLVNGQSFNMEIHHSGNGPTIDLNSKNLADIKNILGVYPPGCSRCVDNIGVAPAFGSAGGTTTNCPGYGRSVGPMPTGSCKTGNEFDPDRTNPDKPNFCQIDRVLTGGDYKIIFK